MAKYRFSHPLHVHDFNLTNSKVVRSFFVWRNIFVSRKILEVSCCKYL